MKIAIYPGSFNPWHKGHEDVLEKALVVFDRIIVAEGINQEKSAKEVNSSYPNFDELYGEKVVLRQFKGLLVDFVERCPEEIDAVIRGLRNGHDLQYEMNQQYWNEDLGLYIPIVYFITDRGLAHISSSAIRALESFKKGVV